LGQLSQNTGLSSRWTYVVPLSVQGLGARPWLFAAINLIKLGLRHGAGVMPVRCISLVLLDPLIHGLLIRIGINLSSDALRVLPWDYGALPSKSSCGISNTDCPLIQPALQRISEQLPSLLLSGTHTAPCAI
jgi:hypothetical protein